MFKLTIGKTFKIILQKFCNLSHELHKNTSYPRVHGHYFFKAINKELTKQRNQSHTYESGKYSAVPFYAMLFPWIWRWTFSVLG